MYYVNEHVKNLNRIFDQNARNGYLRMDLNENPGGLPEDFIKGVLNDVTPEFISQYPETLEFTEKLAGFIGADKDQICLTNGSAEGIRYVIEAYTRPHGKILSVTPTYAMYDVYAEMYGRENVHVQYNEDLEIDVNDILKAINKDIDLLILLNPNNPVGNVYSEEEMTSLIEAAKGNEVTVMIDEAYHYFYPNTFLHFALENDHVFVTRTFSKLFSLAGCRLGYVAGKSDGISIVQKLCTPHNVNAFAMKFVQSMIEEDGLIDSLIVKQREGKKYLIDTLKADGYTVNAKEGNFIFIKPKNKSADDIVSAMKERKILIKSYDGIKGMGACLRVTTGEKELMEVFIKNLREIDV